MELLIAGDLVPTQSNINLFNKADVDTLLGEELLLLWNSVDGRIFNLETPLIDKAHPISKCGPNLIAPTAAVKGIKALNPSLITLANNHILDQGIEGINSTTAVLEEEKINFVGVGNNNAESHTPYIIEKGEIRIGVYACAENEFSIATEKLAGANPFDPLESLDHIQNLKFQCDHVIVLYHGGKEHYRYPSPYLQKVCRKMVEKGADLIVCQHSHCIGSYEEYAGATIVYGQGNFIFDLSEDELWQTSLLIKVDVGEKLNVGYIPIIKSRNTIALASNKISKEILSKFNERSKEILQEGILEKKYRKLAEDNIKSYLRNISGVNKWISRIDRHLLNGKLIKWRYNKKQCLRLLNYIECEAHRELIIEGLKNKEKKYNES